jgi:mannitol-specific phosphotransferase system IIBC component
VSQCVTIAVLLQGGVALLLEAIAEAGAQIAEEEQLRTADGRTHRVKYVARDAEGGVVGVQVDAKSGEAKLVVQDCDAGRGSQASRGEALAKRIAQRYATSRVTEELRRKGYQLAREEKQVDGTLKQVWQRWR